MKKWVYFEILFPFPCSLWASLFLTLGHIVFSKIIFRILHHTPFLSFIDCLTETILGDAAKDHNSQRDPSHRQAKVNWKLESVLQDCDWCEIGDTLCCLLVVNSSYFLHSPWLRSAQCHNRLHFAPKSSRCFRHKNFRRGEGGAPQILHRTLLFSPFKSTISPFWSILSPSPFFTLFSAKAPSCSPLILPLFCQNNPPGGWAGDTPF